LILYGLVQEEENEKNYFLTFVLVFCVTMGCSKGEGQKTDSLTLRCEPSDALPMKDVKKMMKKNDFFARFINRDGKFENKLVNNEDGTVTDEATLLMWEKHASSVLVKCEDVDSYIDELNSSEFAGYSDWRFPTIEEIASLLDKNFRPLNMSDVFTFDMGGGGIAYWSSDTDEEGRAFYIGLVAATVSVNYFGDNYKANAKAVRSL